MKGIFLNYDAKQIDFVYSNELKQTLLSEVLIDENVYNVSDIEDDPKKFRDVEFIFSTGGMPTLSETEIKHYFPLLKCVFYAAGTVQYFAKPFLNCGVKVFSAWAANAVPVAEYTTAQIVLSNKGMFRLSHLYKNKGHTASVQEICNYKGNYGEKIGIIGAGMICKLVIKMLKAYNLDVVVFDPFLSDETAKELGVEKVSLEKLFAECSVVSNHLADNSETKGMLNFELFSKMRPYATFLNTGRGAQVVENDLVAVLKQRPDLTAILDVTDPEPPVIDSKLYRLENCILTPHIAGSLGDEVHRMSQYMYDEFKNYTNGKDTNYEVTMKMLKTMA